MWAGLIHHATLGCFYHCSKAHNLKYCSLHRNDTACRPHSTTQHYTHYSTTLHLTLDTTRCTLPCCKPHFTITTTGPIHFRSPTEHITTEVHEHHLTSQLAPKTLLEPSWVTAVNTRRDSDLPQVGVRTLWLTHCG